MQLDEHTTNQRYKVLHKTRSVLGLIGHSTKVEITLSIQPFLESYDWPGYTTYITEAVMFRKYDQLLGRDKGRKLSYSPKPGGFSGHGDSGLGEGV